MGEGVCLGPVLPLSDKNGDSAGRSSMVERLPSECKGLGSTTTVNEKICQRDICMVSPVSVLILLIRLSQQSCEVEYYLSYFTNKETEAQRI